ncbi:MAG: hypothetical protein RBR24_04180, partial [Candidatus Carbobacillus sp.]|nr:hypothetical protein [Candidatus Carbobacillus sp.]
VHDNDRGRKDSWIYVGKNARLKNAEISGLTWYVQNNFSVDEALQTPELIIYINGNTRIKKIKHTIHNSRIIIFSNGNIEEIKFDESAPNEPLMIDAYLYTNGNLSIKADRSAQIVIHGGLFAHGSIILDSKPTNKKPPKKKNDAIQYAYLSIVHNPELILNPPHGAEEMTLNKMTVKVVKTE